MLKLEPQLKTKWLEALRSGQYKQSRNVLYYRTIGNVHYMCCLGVFEHVCGTELKEMCNGQTLPTQIHRNTPEEILCQPAIEISGNKYDNDSIELHLARLNDSGKTFEDIAEIIEKHL